MGVYRHSAVSQHFYGFKQRDLKCIHIKVEVVTQPFLSSKQHHSRLENTWKISNPTSSSKQSQCWLESNFCRCLSTWVLKTIKVGDCKTSPGILFHFSILLLGEKFHQMELSCFSLYLLFLICCQKKLFHSYPDMPRLCVYFAVHLSLEYSADLMRGHSISSR